MMKFVMSVLVRMGVGLYDTRKGLSGFEGRDHPSWFRIQSHLHLGHHQTLQRQSWMKSPNLGMRRLNLILRYGYLVGM